MHPRSLLYALLALTRVLHVLHVLDALTGTPYHTRAWDFVAFWHARLRLRLQVSPRHVHIAPLTRCRPFCPS